MTQTTYLRAILATAKSVERVKLHALAYILKENGVAIPGRFTYTDDVIYNAQIDLELDQLASRGEIAVVSNEVTLREART